MKKFKFVPPQEPSFPLEEIKELFNQYKEIFLKHNIDSYEKLYSITGNFLFAVYTHGKLEGCLFCTDWNMTGDKYTDCQIGGFAVRKQHNSVEAVKGFCDYLFERFDLEHIYSETFERHARIALLKAGFKKLNNSMFIRSNYELAR